MPTNILHTVKMVESNPDFLDLLSTNEQISFAMMASAVAIDELFGEEV